MGDKGQDLQTREPVTQISEAPDGAKLIVELPGVPQDSIRMALSGDVVKVEAQGTRGKFSTIQVMPFEPDPEGVSISFSQGVFEVSLKRKPSQNPPQTSEVPKDGPSEVTFSMGPPAREAEALRKELERVNGERSSLENRLKLLMIDYQNLKRRYDNEKETLADKRMEETAKELIEVLDVFRLGRASVLALGGSDPQVTQIMKGLDMIENGIISLFKRIGLVNIGSVGKEFDPNLHESIGFVERADLADGMVVEEVRRGFAYKGRTVRPAHVIVNKLPEECEGAKGKKVKGHKEQTRKSKVH